MNGILIFLFNFDAVTHIWLQFFVFEPIVEPIIHLFKYIGGSEKQQNGLFFLHSSAHKWSFVQVEALKEKFNFRERKKPN